MPTLGSCTVSTRLNDMQRGCRSQAWDKDELSNGKSCLPVEWLLGLLLSTRRVLGTKESLRCNTALCGRETKFFDILTKWSLNKDKKSEARWVIFIVHKIQ